MGLESTTTVPRIDVDMEGIADAITLPEGTYVVVYARMRFPGGSALCDRVGEAAFWGRDELKGAGFIHTCLGGTNTEEPLLCRVGVPKVVSDVPVILVPTTDTAIRNPALRYMAESYRATQCWCRLGSIQQLVSVHPDRLVQESIVWSLELVLGEDILEEPVL